MPTAHILAPLHREQPITLVQYFMVRRTSVLDHRILDPGLFILQMGKPETEIEQITQGNLFIQGK